MRVKMSKHSSWFGPYHLAEKILFFIPKETDEYGFKHTRNIVHKFGEFLAYGSIRPEPKVGELTSFAFDDDLRKPTWLYKLLIKLSPKHDQKVSVKIDPWDTWSMDYTLGLIALPMLKQLKETKHGAPNVDSEDVPQELWATPVEETEYNEKGTTDANFFKRWDYVLDEMIFAFETKVGDLRDWEEQFSSGNWDKRWKKLEDGNYEMVKGENDTYEIDWEGRKAYQERISNGFRLFGKYYESLWD